MFKLALTFDAPADGDNVQRGFPEVGAGAQNNGYVPVSPNGETVWAPKRPTKGRRTFFKASQGDNVQRGFPEPLSELDMRPAGSMPNVVESVPRTSYRWTPPYDRGADADVPYAGYILSNPIGAGIVYAHDPQTMDGPTAEYHNSALWWVSQAIPVSVGLQGLNNAFELEDLLGNVLVQGSVRTTG
jgi:hypothetical protein